MSDPGDGVSGPVDDLAVAEAALEDYGGRTRAALIEVLPSGSPAPWLYDLLGRYPRRPGKALRPTLFLATCEAFGGAVDAAVGIAVAIELLHNAFLVHDDIVDGSLRRRGAPTLHEEAGVGLALNAGDALFALAQRQLRLSVEALPASAATAVFEEFETMLVHTTEGQATELGWCRDGVVDLEPEDYLDLIMHKTCWYTTIHPLRVGAIVGASQAPGSATPDLDAMIRFGFHFGAAFQIQDDILNLTGDERYGKEIGGDLLEGKRTLMLIHLRQQVTGRDRRLVDQFLAGDRATRRAEDAATILALMDRHGSIDFARAYARGVAGEAASSFDAAFGALPGVGSNPGAAAVRSLISYMHRRLV